MRLESIYENLKIETWHATVKDSSYYSEKVSIKQKPQADNFSSRI